MSPRPDPLAPEPIQGLRNANHRLPPALNDLDGRSARLYGAFGVTAPWIGALSWLLMAPAWSPEWQSGRVADGVALLMQPLATLPFWSLLGLATWAVWTVLSDPVQHGHSPTVRLGLFAGIVIGAQYTLLIWMVSHYSLVAGSAIACILLWYADSTSEGEAPGTHASSGGGERVAIGCSLALIALSTLMIPLGFETSVVAEPAVTIGLLLMVGLMASWPAGLLIVCIRILRRVRQSAATQPPDEPRPIAPGAFGGALALYFAAWAAAITSAIVEYDSLPLEPPPDDCYVANAACRGHRAWVRAEWIQPPDGAAFPMNDQLRTLKAGEIALRALLPRTHRVLRRIYDRAGPPLAVRIQNPWLADIAYAALIPAALLTRAMFRLIDLTPKVDRWGPRP